MKKFDLLSIVVPCYNEAGNIPELVARIRKMPIDDMECILVNNGSTDNTDSVLKSLLDGDPFIRSIHIDKNQGYGHGILAGLDNANGDVLGWIHADLQIAPECILTGLELIPADKRDIWFIKGSRKNRSMGESILTGGMSFFESCIFREGLWDINAQPTLMPRALYQQWRDPPQDFSLDLYSYVVALKSKAIVNRFPVVVEPRQLGESSWNTGIVSKIKLVTRTLKYSFTLLKTIRNQYAQKTQ